MKIFIIYTTVAIVVVVLAVGALLVAQGKAPWQRSEYDERLVELYARFDPERPGRGVLDYPDNPIGDVAKSYAMIVMAELARERAGLLPELPSLLDTAGTWLLDNPNRDDAGHVGWGLPVGWDAYGDGSFNPANSIYSISTAIVVDALLDWSESQPDAPRERILAAVTDALDGFVNAPPTPDGLLPYSLQEGDRPYDTFNSAAYLAGQMQRFAQIVSEQRYRDAADRTMESLLRNHKTSAKGNWYWTYSIQENRSNDLPHASYIIDGIVAYAENTGRLADEFNIPAVKELLFEYIEEGPESKTKVRAWPIFETDVTLPARLYDIGIALYVSCSQTDLLPLIQLLLSVVESYRTENGFLKYPAETPNLPPLIVNEYEAYLWLGLTWCRDLA